MFLFFQLVVGSMGWQSYCVLVPEETQEMCGKLIKLVRVLKVLIYLQDLNINTLLCYILCNLILLSINN